MDDYGRPLSLGDATDRADGEALLAVLRASKGVLERHGASGARHLAREALWDVWEHPRLPPPLVSSKYPKRYLWSAAARGVYATHNGRRPRGGWGLVLEHMIPRGEILRVLVERSEDLDAAELIAELRQRLVATVVTRQDDRALTAAGVGSPSVEHADPADMWARYRKSGLNPETFAPLAE